VRRAPSAIAWDRCHLVCHWFRSSVLKFGHSREPGRLVETSTPGRSHLIPNKDDAATRSREAASVASRSWKPVNIAAGFHLPECHGAVFLVDHVLAVERCQMRRIDATQVPAKLKADAVRFSSRGH
jgi:hypothetical protein